MKKRAAIVQTFPMCVQRYAPRFVTEAQLVDLYNLFHLARVPLSGTDRDTPHGRMVWAAREFHKANPTISEMAAYKDLSGSREGGA